MASNFWQSSHYLRWMFTKEKVKDMRRNIQIRTNFPTEHELVIQTYFIRHIQLIGRRLRYKQVVVATATAFFKRFYLLASVIEHDPRIVAPTMLYLAVKVEEMGQLRPESILNENNARNESLRLKSSDIFACEIIVLAKLNFDLVVFHPYQDLERFVIDATQDANGVFGAAWSILNDAQRSDCILVYPPSIIALAALYIASVYANIDTKQWFDELNLNLDKVRECASDIIEASKMDQDRTSKIGTALREMVPFWKTSRPPTSTTA